MRLLSVVLGAPSESIRADDSERLLNYGFRFFESHELYKSNQPVKHVEIYKGKTNQLAIGVLNNHFITIPAGQFQRVSVKTQLQKNLQAPIKKGDKVGNLMVEFENKVIDTHPLYALNSVEKGGIYTRTKDSIRLMFKRWFGS